MAMGRTPRRPMKVDIHEWRLYVGHISEKNIKTANDAQPIRSREDHEFMS